MILVSTCKALSPGDTVQADTILVLADDELQLQQTSNLKGQNKQFLSQNATKYTFTYFHTCNSSPTITVATWLRKQQQQKKHPRHCPTYA